MPFALKRTSSHVSSGGTAFSSALFIRSVRHRDIRRRMPTSGPSGSGVVDEELLR